MVCLEIHDTPKTFLVAFYRLPNFTVDKWKIISGTIERRPILEIARKNTVIITGDLNNDLLQGDSCQLMHIINCFGLTQLIKDPTKPVSGTLLAWSLRSYHM